MLTLFLYISGTSIRFFLPDLFTPELVTKMLRIHLQGSFHIPWVYNKEARSKA